jgi:hypothetical protein
VRRLVTAIIKFSSFDASSGNGFGGNAFSPSVVGFPCGGAHDLGYSNERLGIL